MLSHRSVFIAIVACLNVLGCGWLIWWTARSRPDEVSKGEVIDHVWDGDLQERNNPMPRWWLILFFLSIIFCFLYFRCIRRWAPSATCSDGARRPSTSKKWLPPTSNTRRCTRHSAVREIEDLAKDSKALALGRSLFANNCIACHGSDARGAPGFPNLTDNDWLHGGAPAQIIETITHGREGIMPALGAALGDQGVKEVAAYALSLSGRKEPPQLVEAGKNRFVLCAACHGADGKGNQAIGAPNLTDDNWLYGGTDAAVYKSVKDGRHGQMPPHAWLGEDKIRLLSAYVYSLSHAP